ncbi:MAG TPA: family 1 encapsulin nanocompartment shell protein [Polyangiaceae bacterium]|nr:family 1 encapsulin nanocompartment shell protein [Polyangiaceae bacterium]
MDLLKREIAPINDDAWQQIDEEARRVLSLHLSGRKLVDFSGPHGWGLGAVNSGRLSKLEQGSVPQVSHAIRVVQPLIELRVPIALNIAELDNATRGAKDLDLEAVIAAAGHVALAEDTAIYFGFAPGKITGMVEASPHTPVQINASQEWPRAISAAREVLRLAGVGGPYGLALGGAAYDELTAESDDGYPLRKRVEESITDGSLVWAPALGSDAVLVSLRGGDYELVVGQDLSVGYESHDRTSVELYLTESFTFRVLENKAAVALRRTPRH